MDGTGDGGPGEAGRAREGVDLIGGRCARSSPSPTAGVGKWLASPPTPSVCTMAPLAGSSRRTGRSRRSTRRGRRRRSGSATDVVGRLPQHAQRRRGLQGDGPALASGGTRSTPPRRLRRRLRRSGTAGSRRAARRCRPATPGSARRPAATSPPARSSRSGAAQAKTEPRSRSAMLSANQLLGANSCSSPSPGESSMVESLPS